MKPATQLEHLPGYKPESEESKRQKEKYISTTIQEIDPTKRNNP